MTNVFILLPRVYANFVILDGRLFARIEGPPTAEHSITYLRRSLEGKDTMTVLTYGVLEFWLMK